MFLNKTYERLRVRLLFLNTREHSITGIIVVTYGLSSNISVYQTSTIFTTSKLTCN